VVAERYIAKLIELAAGGHALPGVTARTEAHLAVLAEELDGDRFSNGSDRRLRRMIERHLTRPAEPMSAVPKPPETPPGSPIGGGVGSAHLDRMCWMCTGQAETQPF